MERGLRKRVNGTYSALSIIRISSATWCSSRSRQDETRFAAGMDNMMLRPFPALFWVSFLHALQNSQCRAEVLSVQRAWEAPWLQIQGIPALPVQPSNALFGQSAQLFVQV